MARSAYELAPENPSIADTLGWILLQKGNIPEALDLLRNAHEGSPGNPEVTYHYGAALARNGDTASAAQLLGDLLASGQTFTSRDDAVGLMRELK
jgi:Flp pilus assembly protein TadD